MDVEAAKRDRPMGRRSGANRHAREARRQHAQHGQQEACHPSMAVAGVDPEQAINDLAAYGSRRAAARLRNCLKFNQSTGLIGQTKAARLYFRQDLTGAGDDAALRLVGEQERPFPGRFDSLQPMPGPVN